VSIDVFDGEIHALVGENGAGKSTLMKMLCGCIRPDSGRILFAGRPVVFRSPREAMRAGIGMVHQQLLIFPQLTTLENIIAGAEPKRWGILNRKTARKKITDLCGLFGFGLPLDTQAGDISYAHRQQVELLRILFRGTKVLVLDEPTSLLSPPEVQQFLGLLRYLKSQGYTVVFITHRLPEVFAVADRISVLRLGRSVDTFAVPQVTMEKAAKLILSSELEAVSCQCAGQPANQRDLSVNVEHSPERDETLLALDRVTAKAEGHESDLRDFCIEIRKGEILGIGGVVGNGQRTLARIIAGFTKASKGSVLYGNREITQSDIGDRIFDGIGWLPANAQEEALLESRPLWENLLLGHQRRDRFQQYGMLSKRSVFAWAEEHLKEYNVAFNDLRQPLAELSGGNQQKVALARYFSHPPSLLILEQPGKGLDIYAQQRLCSFVSTLNARGTTFLILSYDLEELLSMCHRVGVLYRGKLMGTMQRGRFIREELGKWMLGMSASES
jgi:simple sugar transport system ATP-binding protein